MEEGILPKLLQSDAYFARIPVNSVILLEPELSGTEEAVSVDYWRPCPPIDGKILAALTSLQSAYDWNLNAGFVEDQDGEDTNTTTKPFAPITQTFWAYAIRAACESPKISRRRNHSLSDCIPILSHESRPGYDQTLSEQALCNQSDSLEDELQFRKD